MHMRQLLSRSIQLSADMFSLLLPSTVSSPRIEPALLRPHHLLRSSKRRAAHSTTYEVQLDLATSELRFSIADRLNRCKINLEKFAPGRIGVCLPGKAGRCLPR